MDSSSIYFSSIIKGYKDFALAVIGSAKKDLLSEKKRSEIILWLDIHKDEKDPANSKRRTLREMRLIRDRSARLFFAGDDYNFWADILELHNS